MAVNAATLETYDSVTIREDLSDAENMISPTETPFISMIAGENSATATKHEWPLVELQAVNNGNRVIEGDDAPPVDTAVTAFRRWNFTQISDKLISVSDTSQKVDGAANVEKLAKQISYKLKELKRDKETMLLDNVPGNPGASGTARAAAGLPAFIITNYATVGSGATAGAPGTLSDPPNGYPDAGATNATTKGALTEDALNLAIQQVWTQGGDPRRVIVSPVNKRLISKTFTGNATKFKDADEKKIITAVDVYESDFGQVQIVADRFSRPADVLIIDPEFVKVSYLQKTRQLDVARTGHSEKKLIQCEYTLEVGNEKAMALIADTLG